jgi:hypothetical protein
MAFGQHITDTDPVTEKVYISLLQKATILMLTTLTGNVTFLSKRAIQRANPGMNKQERDIEFVKLHYGKDLAEKLKKYLQIKHEKA